jgi:hypothetical protein
MGASISLTSTAQAATSATTASQRPAVSETAPTCLYSSKNLHFDYWGPYADKSLVWSSRGSKSGNGVLLGDKSSSSPLDCFKALSYGHSEFAFQQNNSSLCLNVSGNSKKAGAWIILYDCVSTSNELFGIDTIGEETQLVSQSSGLCIDAVNGFSAYSQLEQEPCSSSKYQEWYEATS